MVEHEGQKIVLGYKIDLPFYKCLLNQQPTTNNQQPTTNNQQPTANNQQPTTNNQQPLIHSSTLIKNMASTSEDNVTFLMEHRDSFIHESEQLLYQRVLELCIAQTFAKIKVEGVAIDKSQDTDENKKSKKNRLMGMAQWGLKMQKDLDNMKTGKSFDETSETTRLIVGKEVDKLLKSYTFPEMLHTISVQLAAAKDIINKNDH